MEDLAAQVINFKEKFENLINQVESTSSGIQEFIYYASSEEVANLIKENFPGQKTVVLPKFVPNDDGKDVVYIIPSDKPIKVVFEENKTV